MTRPILTTDTAPAIWLRTRMRGGLDRVQVLVEIAPRKWRVAIEVPAIGVETEVSHIVEAIGYMPRRKPGHGPTR